MSYVNDRIYDWSKFSNTEPNYNENSDANDRIQSELKGV